MFEALIIADLTPKLPTYKSPTLIVNGEHDTALLGGTRTAGLIPDAEHRILPRTGHCCFLEDPGGFEVIVREFLQRNDLWPPPNALDSTPAHNQSSETASTGL